MRVSVPTLLVLSGLHYRSALPSSILPVTCTPPPAPTFRPTRPASFLYWQDSIRDHQIITTDLHHRSSPISSPTSASSITMADKNAKPALTARETEVLGLAWQCFKTQPEVGSPAALPDT